MKKILCIEVLFIMAVLFSGCGFNNIAKPERFGIKTSDEARYTLSIAKQSFDIGQFFSISSFLRTDETQNENDDSAEMYKLYDYDPKGSNDNRIQQYLLKMDVESIPLDFSTAINDTNITTSLKNMSISKTIEVPDVNRSEQKSMELKVNEKVNALVTINGYTGRDSRVSFLSTSGIPGNGFSSITYKSGFMEIQANPLTNATAVITGSIILKREIGDRIIELTRAEFVNGKAELPLEGVTIVKNGLMFDFTESTNVNFIGRVDSNSVVQKAEGLTISEGVPITVSQEIPINGDENLSYYTIDRGSLDVEFSLPEEWRNQGVSVQYEMTLSGALDNEVLTQDQTTLSLDNKTFYNSSKINIDVSGSFSLNNATLLFIDDNNKPVNPSISVNVSVSKIKEAVIKLDANYNTSITENAVLPQDVMENVKKIRWDKYGFEISCINTLPPDNPVVVECTSDFFKFNKEKRTLPTTNVSAGEEEPEAVPLYFVNESDKNNGIYFDIDIGDPSIPGNEGKFNSVDIVAEIKLPGYDPDEHTITIKNLETAKAYKLDLEVKPVLEWDEIWISTEERHANDKISTGMNLSSIFGSMEEAIGSDVANNLEFTNIPLYLFAETPASQELFNDIKFKGIIKAYIGDDDGNPVEGMENKGEYLLGKYDKTTGTETGTYLQFSKGLSLKVEENNVVNTDISTELLGKKSANLATLLNSRAEGNLCVSYDIGLETTKTSSTNETAETADVIIVTRELLENMKRNGSTTVSLSVLGIIPLEFKVKEDIEMNLLKLIGKDTDDPDFDLLDRKEAPDNSKIEEYTVAVKDVTISYQPSKIPFLCASIGTRDNMTLCIDMDGNRSECEEKELTILGDKLSLKPSELLTYPLNPSVKLKIPQGRFSIKRDTVFDIKLDVSIATNGEIIWLDNKKNEQEGGNY